MIDEAKEYARVCKRTGNPRGSYCVSLLGSFVHADYNKFTTAKFLEFFSLCYETKFQDEITSFTGQEAGLMKMMFRDYEPEILLKMIIEFLVHNDRYGDSPVISGNNGFYFNRAKLNVKVKNLRRSERATMKGETKISNGFK